MHSLQFVERFVHPAHLLHACFDHGILVLVRLVSTSDLSLGTAADEEAPISEGGIPVIGEEASPVIGHWRRGGQLYAYVPVCTLN
jgi:hypothetical protein